MAALILPSRNTRISYPISEKWLRQEGVSFYAPFETRFGARPAFTAAHGFAHLDPSTLTVDADGTRVNQNTELIEQAHTNVLRIERNGALFEGARTNLCRRSEELDHADWALTRATITENDRAAPDGTTTADKLVEDTSLNTTHFNLTPTVAFVSGTRYVCGVFARAAERDELQIQFHSTPFPGFPTAFFDLTGGGSVGTLDANIDSAGIDALADGWFFCWATSTADANSTRGVLIVLSDGNEDTTYTGDGSSGLHFWGCQIEAGDFPSSYIPTTSASEERTAEDLRYTITSEDIAKAAQGTIVVAVRPEYVAADNPNNSPILDFRTANDGILLDASEGDNLYGVLVRSGGSTVADLNSITAAVRGITNILAVSWKLNEFTFYVAGSQEDQDTVGAAPTAIGTTLFVGQDLNSAFQFFGNIAHLMIFDRVRSPGFIAYVSDFLGDLN